MRRKFVVFRTELDIKAHRLEWHSDLMTKAASKEARRVELNFNSATDVIVMTTEVEAGVGIVEGRSWRSG